MSNNVYLEHNEGYPNTASSTASSSTQILALHPASMDPKRRSSQDRDSNKKVKTEDPSQFSAAVKKKLQQSSRTGQACDRCKIRKIRCDALPGGCSSCLQTSTTCQTTDRTTGQTRVRGAEERLEDENKALREQVKELTNQLEGQRPQSQQSKSSGRATNEYHSISPVGGYGYNGTTAEAAPAVWDRSGLPVRKDNTLRIMPDAFLGVNTSPSNPNLSSISGTVLSIFGMEIDIADFKSEDVDDPDTSTFDPRLYNKSYQAFLQTTFNLNERITRVDLPTRTEGFSYAQWYFRTLNPYSPLLHESTFLRLLTRIYDDATFIPRPSELVIVHMVFSIMYFHFAFRNQVDDATKADLTARSNQHYHYSLGFFYQLYKSRDVEDIQAMVLLCVHLRNFPKPGASWVLTQTTMTLAIEINLHRSVRRYASDPALQPADIETRRRIFWTLLAMHVTLAGKLNRPQMLRLEDFDVELPEAYADEPSIGGNMSIGLISYRIVPLYLEMYSTIYAVRSNPEDYVRTVHRLESKIQEWEDNLPAALVRGETGQSASEGRGFALYAQVWALEFRMLLRHPSKSTTDNADFNAESMKICVESSLSMLEAVKELQKYKSLDTTWYQVAVYVMAITIILYDKLERRSKITSDELAALTSNISTWLDILEEVGAMIGAGSKIRERVQTVTDGQLGLLARSISSTNYATSVDGSQPIYQRPALPVRYHSQQDYPVEPAGSSNTYIANPAQAHEHTSYPTGTQYNSFPEAVEAQNFTYTTSSTYPTYATSETVTSPMVPPFQATQSHNGLPQPGSTTPFHPTGNIPINLSWQHYANNVVEDVYPASALMQLQGGRDMGNEGRHQGDIGGVSSIQSSHIAGMVGDNISTQWPMVVFPHDQAQKFE